MTVTEELYTPTAADLASQEQTGSPVWGVKTSINRSTKTVRVEALIPRDQIPGLGGSGARSGVKAAGATVGVAGAGSTWARTGPTLPDSLLPATGAGAKYRDRT